MWYYIRSGEPQGPFDERAFADLVAQGVVTSDSMVWNETLTGWTNLRQARPALPVPAIGNSTCTLCQTNVGADNLIDLTGVRVCAACKPLAVQKMREGVGLIGGNTAWRDGKKIVIQDKTRLPARCVKCNAETGEPPLKRKLQWHHPAYYLLLFIYVFIYVIVAICVRKRATAQIYLCTHHRQKRRKFIIGAWAAAAGAFVLVFVGGIMSIASLVVTGVFIFLAAFIGGIFGAAVLRTIRIKGKTVWLAGAGPKFLASLPQWPG